MNNREAAKTIETAKRFAYDKKFEEAFDAGIKALEQTEWIPVTERLPEKSGLYLVSTGDLVTTLSFCGHSFRTHFADEYGVNAWRPLPEPYKEEKE